MTLSILFVNFLTLILLSFFGWCVVLQNIWHIAGVRAHMQRNRYLVGAYMYDGTLALTRNWRKHIRLLIEKVICSLPSVSAWQFHSYLLDFSHRRWCSGPARTGIRPSRLGDDSPWGCNMRPSQSTADLAYVSWLRPGDSQRGWTQPLLRSMLLSSVWTQFSEAILCS